MKQFIWNTSNYESESHKSCHIGEYLDYENCKCRKTLIVKLAKISSAKHECVCNSFCTFLLCYFQEFLQ